MFSLWAPSALPSLAPQTATLRANQIAALESGGPGEGRGGIQYLVGRREGDERMWSGAELTGVQSIAWRALIIADAFKEALRGQLNISKHKELQNTAAGKERKSRWNLRRPLPGHKARWRINSKVFSELTSVDRWQSSQVQSYPRSFCTSAFGHSVSFILEMGGGSQNSSALVFVHIVLARPQPVFQWTCSFRGQGILPGRSQFNRSEGEMYQSRVLWLEYTEGNGELLSQVLSWVRSLHVRTDIIKTHKRTPVVQPQVLQLPKGSNVQICMNSRC